MKFIAENDSGLRSTIRKILEDEQSELSDVSLRFSSIIVCELKEKTNDEKESRRGTSIDDIISMVENTIRFPCEISNITGEGNTRKISIVHV